MTYWGSPSTFFHVEKREREVKIKGSSRGMSSKRAQRGKDRFRKST